MSGETRLEILTRIHRAGAREERPFERAGVRGSSRPGAVIIEQFAEYAAEYRANVTRVRPADVPHAIRQLLAQRGSERVVVPADLPENLLPEGWPVQRDENLSTAELDSMQAVITTCAAATAESGTIVLDHGSGQGRRALTLVPDHHVCVVYETQVMDTIPETVARLRDSVLAGRPLTWISGPSATSDIELSRVEGVHGPRVLDVILVLEN